MKYLAFSILTVGGLFNKCYTQCCSPGNPAGGIGPQGVMEKKLARVALLYKGGYSNTYYGGNIGGSKPISADDPSFIPAVKNANYNFVGLNFRFGITDKLTIENDFGYFINKTQNYISGILPQKLKGYGLTDLGTQLKLQVLKKSEWEIVPGIGIKVPVGPTEQLAEDGTIMPLELQPTTGAFYYTASLLLYKGFPEKHLRFFLDLKSELSTVTKVSQIDYKYGNAFFFSLYTSYSFPKTTILIQIRSENRTQDIKYENPSRIIYSTGSSKVFFVPQINYKLNAKWDVMAFADFPVYQYYKGKQLASLFAAGISIFRLINFSKNQTK